MLNISEAVFSADGTTIVAVIDGVTVYVPVDSDNRHYRIIQTWVAEGNSIAPFKEDIEIRRSEALQTVGLQALTRRQSVVAIDAYAATRNIGKAREVDRFFVDDNPQASDYPLIEFDRQIFGRATMADEAAASRMLELQWGQIDNAIRSVELPFLTAIQTATTLEEIETVYNSVDWSAVDAILAR